MKKSPSMKSAPAIEALRANLTGLLDTCPADQCNPPECPLFRVRKLGRAQRLRWFNALSEDDLKYLASYCHVCMKLRLHSRPASEPVEA